MFINPGDIRTWLYTSEFKDRPSHEAIMAEMDRFNVKNKALNLSGFLITNGSAIMQLLEGEHEAVEPLKQIISKDNRHSKVETHVWELEASRAYPHWSMRAIDPLNYEALFKEIESAKVATIATDIARLLFDVTFES